LKTICSLFFASIFLLTACARKPAAAAALQPEAPPSATLVATPAALNECVKCHTDKQLLIDTTKPTEAVVKESTGTG
jgi:hypothetical protein